MAPSLMIGPLLWSLSAGARVGQRVSSQMPRRLAVSHGPLRIAAATGTKAAMDARKEAGVATNFVRNIIKDDLESGKHSRLVTRFPPEPNGFLHIGHAKSICLNFGLAEEFSGITYMRLDDTNPLTEETRYVDSILDDVKWLGGDWEDRLTHASDYFEALYQNAEHLIEDSKAYVDSASPETIREYRGNYAIPARPTPDRERPAAQSLELFRRMRAGEFGEGEYVLRAKIDLAAANMNMRDPVIYRVRHASHQITGDAWCIYPMYDYAHPISDALESVTHSLCTLEFQDHRPLYDWVLHNMRPAPPCAPLPRQIEVSRLNIHFTVLSKRKLIRLVDEGHVHGWDDPRMPTIAGIRRRGYPAAAIRLFCERTGISKEDKNIDIAVLEDCARETLDQSAGRAMAVLRPLKVVVTNWPEDKLETLEGPVHPKRPELGVRQLTMSRTLFIDEDDFALEPQPKFFRLSPGAEVRLRNAYAIRCDEVVRDDTGAIAELRCTYDESTRQGAGRKIKGIVHWVSAEAAVPITVRLWDRLFTTPAPGANDPERNFLADLNPQSSQELTGALGEASLADAQPGAQFQFERLGYYAVDTEDSTPGSPPVFNRVVTLRDTWGKLSATEAEAAAKAIRELEALS
jgi:glutaminyl-tRNA synthetase